MALLTKSSVGNSLLTAVAILTSLLVLEFAARWMLSDIGTTGQRSTYLSRRWYAANPPQLNHLKFREREFGQSAAPGVMRIALVGDSFTYAPGIIEAQRVSDRLEAELNSSDGSTFEVLNFGEPGANYEQHEVNLRLALETARPHYVLLQWYLNDLNDPTDPWPRPHPLGSVLHHELSAVSVLYFLAARVFDDAQIKFGGADIDSYYARFLDPADPLASRADVRFRRILDVARDAHVPIGVFLWPELSRPLDTSPNDPLIDRLLETCRDEQIECVDLRPALRTERRHERLIVNRFDTHASAEANAMAADLLIVRLGDQWRTAAKALRDQQKTDPIVQVVQ
jgi:hypothetical protein